MLERLKSWAGALLPSAWLAPMRGAGGMLAGLVREPFTGAWQRNIACHDPAHFAFSAVYACITIISGDVAKLGVYLYKRNTQTGVRELALYHPIARVLRRPNDYQTGLELVQAIIISVLATGNAYLLKRRDARGVISALYLIDPRQVHPIIADDGSVLYALGGDLRLAEIEQGRQVVVPAREIIHHRINAIGHALIGTSPLIAAAMSANVGANIVANSSALFANMSRPGGQVITPPNVKISEPMAARIKKEFQRNYSGSNLGEVAVLGEGLKFEAAGIVNAVDAQLIEQLRWTIEDVARAFRVPGFMLGDLTKVTYRNSEQLQRTYYSGCLQYHIEMLEARLHEGLELDETHFVEFDLDNLLRTEMDVRFDAYAKAIGAGFYVINDARRGEDLPPVKGGDEPLVQMQYRPLSAAIAEAELAVKKAERELAAPPPPAVPPPAADPPAPPDPAADEAQARALTEELIKGLQRYVRGDA